MKIIPDYRKRHYTTIFSVFLIVVALIAGMLGCDGTQEYTLSISSTSGGNVTNPRTGTFVYPAGAVVLLEVVAEEGYGFTHWSGNVSTIADINSTTTSITMDGHYLITANFELGKGWYSLTIFCDYGGWITEPGEGYFAYAANTTIDLVAEPDEDYRFKEWTGDVDTIANVNNATTTITMSSNYSLMANFGWYNITQIAADGDHTVGLKSDGTMVAVGWNNCGQCNVGSWTDITQIAAGCGYTVGLKPDGTVLAVGYNRYGRCNVGNWTDITQIAAGCTHTVGLKADGTVVAVGGNGHGECNVGNWTDITQVIGGRFYTVGLKAGGTVVAVGKNSAGQCNVGNWTDITQVAADSAHTVGLKSDGTVVAVGGNGHGQCDVGGWTDITQVDAEYSGTVGLKSDGTVVAVGYNNYGQCDVGGWTEITQIAAGCAYTVGLKPDGTVVAVGLNDHGQCNV